MSRRFYIVSYDVTDNDRRGRLHKLLLDYGDWVQYSVFCCELNPRERVRLLDEIRQCIDATADQVLVVEAGPVEGAHPSPEVTVLGRALQMPPRCRII